MTILFIGTTELLIIGGIALLIFGGKKVPELMKGLGKGVKSFKEGMNEPLNNDKVSDNDEHKEEQEGEETKKKETTEA